MVAAYQLSTYKRHHLEHCRAPLDIADTGSDIRSTARFAVRLAASSVGCCWALMALVVVVGSMNLLWMAAITVLLSAELLVRRGERLAEVIGVLLGIGGVAVLLSVLA
jgi:predicted metal-binding membrane protein